MMSLQEDNIIIDRYFYQSLKRANQAASKYLCYYATRALLLFAAIPVNHLVLEEKTSQPMSLLTIFLISALTYNALELILLSYLYCSRFRSATKILKIALQFHHTFSHHNLKDLDSQNMEDQLSHHQFDRNLNVKVSTIYYDFENMQKLGQVSEESKDVRETNGENLIKNAFESDLPCFKLFSGSLQFLSVAIMAFGLTISSMGVTQNNDAQHTILELFLITEILLKPKIFALLLVICLVPVIAIMMCAYICCCKKKQPQAKLPDKVEVTTPMLSKCSECSICFQPLELKEEVAVLPCSEMHIFHYGCIESWTKVKANCPICRAQLYQ